MVTKGGAPVMNPNFKPKTTTDNTTTTTTTPTTTTPTKTYGYGEEFDEVVGTSPADIKKYQEFVLRFGGDLGTSKSGVPFGADGRIGPISRANKNSPTIATFDTYKDSYKEYLKQNP